MESYLKQKNIVNLKNLADELEIEYNNNTTKDQILHLIINYFEKYDKSTRVHFDAKSPLKSPVKTTLIPPTTRSPLKSPVKTTRTRREKSPVKTTRTRPEKMHFKYTKYEQLGNTGKEGVTYLVRNENGDEYAMKTFKKTKSSSRLQNEADLQIIASQYEVSPKIIEINTEEKYIVMEKLDKHLFDVMKKQNGNLTKLQQQQIIKLYKNLDKAGVFHGDSNILNYMFKEKKLYMIDFGMSKYIDDNLFKKVGTRNPNLDLMTLGFILKLKELKCPETSYSYLLTHVSESDREKYKL